MRAAVCTRWGPPEVLRVTDVERPAPRKREVRIRIVATAVTASDCMARGLKFPRRYRILARLVLGYRAPRRPIFAIVLAGEIESVGRDVRSFQPGDQVFGLSQWKAGCYAEYVCCSAANMETTGNIQYATRLVEQLATDGTVTWYADHPALPGCHAVGPSQEEALLRLDQARDAWIAVSNQLGDEVPSPIRRGANTHSVRGSQGHGACTRRGRTLRRRSTN